RQLRGIWKQSQGALLFTGALVRWGNSRLSAIVGGRTRLGAVVADTASNACFGTTTIATL
ncbi:MAG: hypothetical protein ACPIOQ_20480, partial [Promethearchaeia archaeon]